MTASRRGSMSVGNAPILLVTVAITLIIGVVVIANLVPAIPELAPGDANDTVTNIVETTYASMGLLVVSLIVLAAVAILLVVRMLS